MKDIVVLNRLERHIQEQGDEIIQQNERINMRIIQTILNQDPSKRNENQNLPGIDSDEKYNAKK